MLKTRLFLFAATTALVSGVLAVPTWADVEVRVDVDKTKIITVTELITITKDVEISVNFVGSLEGLAQAEALVNATVTGNVVDLRLRGPLTPLEPNLTKRKAQILNSANLNQGVVLQLNQDVGDNTNQGNVLSAALVDVANIPPPVTIPPTPDPVKEAAAAHAEAAVDQENTNNLTALVATFPPSVGHIDIPETNDDAYHMLAVMEDSMNDNIGVLVQGNQNAGTNTNQHNVVSLAVGIDASLALGESALGQENSRNRTVDLNTYKQARIVDSMSRNQGIVSFNQNVGHNNNQAAVITVAATSAAAGITTPGP